MQHSAYLAVDVRAEICTCTVPLALIADQRFRPVRHTHFEAARATMCKQDRSTAGITGECEYSLSLHTTEVVWPVNTLFVLPGCC